MASELFMGLTRRQKQVVCAALSYALSNVDDLNEALESGEADLIRVNGEFCMKIADDEVDDLLGRLRGDLDDDRRHG